MADTEQVMEDYGLQSQYKENKSRYKMGLTDKLWKGSQLWVAVSITPWPSRS